MDFSVKVIEHMLIIAWGSVHVCTPVITVIKASLLLMQLVVRDLTMLQCVPSHVRLSSLLLDLGELWWCEQYVFSDGWGLYTLH